MTTVHIREDFDGKYAASWPADIVSQGRSAGAGRHTTLTGLVEAIRSAGFEVDKTGPRELEVREVAA